MLLFELLNLPLEVFSWLGVFPRSVVVVVVLDVRSSRPVYWCLYASNVSLSRCRRCTRSTSRWGRVFLFIVQEEVE